MRNWFYNFFYLHKIILYEKEINLRSNSFHNNYKFCFGQDDKIEKYCEVCISKTAIQQKASINFGDKNIYFKDSSVKNDLLAVNNFKNAVDVLDYMSKLGWSLVSTTAYGYGLQFFYFEKKFDKSEFTISNK